MKYNLAKSLSLIIALSFFLIAGFVNNKLSKPLIQISKEDSALNFNADFLNIVSLGQRRLISSFLWISTLLESDLEKFKSKDNKNSWMYMRFKSIANLDSYFLMNYQFGGLYLSIIKDDLNGAEDIFLHGLKFYPDDYKLLSHAAFLFAFELKETDRAIELYSKLVQFPQTPSYMKSLLNKLVYRQNGDLIEVYQLVLNTYHQTDDPILKNKLESDLYSIKATIDLECLNNNQPNCDLKDLNGNFYIKKGDTYVAPREFSPYKLNFIID